MSLSNNLETIYHKIEKAKIRGGVNRPVQLIAVTKTHPFSIINESYAMGIRSIGENRIQEAHSKFEDFSLMPNITKRFIGHLQSNKINTCLELFDTIDSVDSIKLAKKIDKKGLAVQVLLEVNTSGERQKHGFNPEDIDGMIAATETQNIIVKGLMTVGPLTGNEQKIRKSFTLLRELKDEINSQLSANKLTELSMGMSSDFEIGVEEGSTMVRIGSALFGRRQQQ